MKEKKTVFKLFFVWDFEKEERWLNEMAQEGWVLDNTGFSFYTFVRCEPGEYIIRLPRLCKGTGCRIYRRLCQLGVLPSESGAWQL